MSGNRQLSGSDYLMLGFDHELRRFGFAGNSCQIALELGSPISTEALKQRIADLAGRHPILNARPGGAIFPKWNLPTRPDGGPAVRVHPAARPGLCQELFNEPLAVRRGELTRFDLVEREGGRMSLIFTWSHALMDAPGAEHFLSLIGGGTSPPSSPPAAAPSRPKQDLRKRFQLAWKHLHYIDGLCKPAPRSMGVRHPDAPSRLQYCVEKFSIEETARVRANGVSLCGPLGDGQFHAAAAMFELHQLHQRLGWVSPSYVLPVPVGLRPKGSVEPLFGNQMAMLMLQFLPEHLVSMARTVATLKEQTSQMLRTGMLDSGLMLAEMFRFLPLPVYMAILKRGLRGEICSLFYGDTAAVNPLLNKFMGAEVLEFTHAAAVTPTPGIGVIFYYFRGQLRVTVLHSSKVLDDQESAEFAANLRARLLNP